MNRLELFEKMKLASEQEYEAYKLYSQMAAQSTDPELKYLFDKMAGEEMEHREAIMKRYSMLVSVPDWPKAGERV